MAILLGTSNADVLQDDEPETRSTLIGGLGNDLYLLHYPALDANLANLDVISEDSASGTDTVTLISDDLSGALRTVSYDMASRAANVENLTTLFEAPVVTYDGGVLTKVGGVKANITGNALNNAITTGAGDDTLDGGLGNDTMIGGDGNDVYFVNATTDQVVELSRLVTFADVTSADSSKPNVTLDLGGYDIVKASATYTLSANLEELILEGAASINGVGNASANLLTGNTGNNNLGGLAGNDTLIGGAGNDTLLGGDGDDLIDESSDTSGNNSVDGGNGNDTITGGAGRDTLIGGAGNDRILVGTVDAHVDSLVGGTGDDVYEVIGNLDVIVEAAAAGVDTVLVSDINGTTTYIVAVNVENATLVNGAGGNLTGNAAHNRLTGNAGANILTGLAGHDVLDGGLGNDTLIGGDGNDVYLVNASGDVVIESSALAAGGIDTVISDISYTLGANLEHLTLTDNGTTLVGRGNSLNNRILGNSQANKLYGEAGNDTLDGAGALSGFDFMQGGAGNDTYIVHSVLDVILEIAETGTGGKADKIILAADFVPLASAYLLPNQVEQLDASNLSLNVHILGNELANSIIGGAGNDIINGGGGIDTMVGGKGNDTYWVDAATDLITELADGGTDTVYLATATFDLTKQALNVENIVMLQGTNTVTGNALSNKITGNSGANSIAGGNGNDTLLGGYGKDTLIGGNGNDSLDGGAGNDTLDGGAGNDIYVLGTGDIISADTAGVDEIRTALADVTMTDTTTFGAGIVQIEHLTYTGTSAFTAAGNALANSITGGVGADALSGGLGNDTLDGGVGADSLTGGLGNDTYRVDNAGDSVTEATAEGTDTVLVAIATVGGNYALADNVEHAVLTNTVDFDLLGNVLANSLTGNDNHNMLQGIDGNDTLIGGLGNDTLDGGIGNDRMDGGLGDDEYLVDSAKDVVIELVGGGEDKVRVFASAALKTYTMAANIENAAIESSADALLAITGNALDNRINGSTFSDTINGGDGNDLLIGDEGNDSITGGNGNDTLDGGPGTDTLVGGAGNDTYYLTATGGADVIIELLNGGTDFVEVSDNLSSYTLVDNVENITAIDVVSSANLTGNSLNNEITLNRSTDGTFTVSGGAGNDVVNLHIANNGAFTLDIDGGDGTDTLNIEFDADLANIASITTAGLDNFEFVNLVAGSNGTFGITSFDLNGLDVVGVAATKLVSIRGDSATGSADAHLTLTSVGNNTDFVLQSYVNTGTGLVLTAEDGAWTNGEDLNLKLDNVDAKLTLSSLTDTTGSKFALNLDSTNTSLDGDDTNALNLNFDTTDASIKITGNTSLALTSVEATSALNLNNYVGNQLAVTSAGALTLNLNNVSTSLATSGVTTLNLNSAASNSLEFLSVAATSVVVTGDGNLTLVNASGDIINATALTGTFTVLGLATGGALNITGGAGDDYLQGTNAADTLTGGEGDDILFGGSGADIFIFDAPLGSGVDQLLDFVSTSDKIHLQDSIFTGLGGSLVLDTNFFVGADSTGATGVASVFLDTSTGTLYYDGDGSNSEDATAIAQLVPGQTLATSDFVLI